MRGRESSSLSPPLGHELDAEWRERAERAAASEDEGLPEIADFLCVDVKLIIEIDGDAHYQEGAQAHDRTRDAFLRGKGFTVLRLSHRRVLENMDDVVQHIVEVLEGMGSPSP